MSNRTRIFAVFFLSVTELIFAAPFSVAAPSTLDLLSSSSIEQLQEAVYDSREHARRVRACQIQRSQKIVPTLCYGVEGEDKKHGAVAEIDSLCLKLSRTAVQIPKTDRFTSEVCRTALEKRSADLAYAEERDALR